MIAIRMMLLVLVWLISLTDLTADESRSHLRKGNSLFKDGDYNDAELAYRRALEADSQNSKAIYNLANALYRQGRFEEAAELFAAAAQLAPDEKIRSEAYHNLGNALIKSGQYHESIDAYKNALRINPDDEDTRYNLAYAMQFLEDPPPQDQQQEGDDQQHDNDQEDNQQSPPDQQPDDQEQEQQQQQQQPDQLTRQDAERILDALNREEQKVQENVKREESQRQPARVEREW